MSVIAVGAPVHDPASLIETLREAGVVLGLRGGELRYFAEPGRMTPELRQRVRDSRDEILRELSGPSAGGAKTQRLGEQAERLTLKPAAAPIEVQCDSRAAPDPTERVYGGGRVRGPHDPPPRGCYCCDSREFVRVASGPAWFCPRCHPPSPGAEVVERWTAPQPSWWEVRRA